MSIRFSWVTTADQIDPTTRYCHHCDKPLKGKVVMLECDTLTGAYQDGDVPEERSQGWFPFGMTCARKIAAPGASPGQEDICPHCKTDHRDTDGTLTPCFESIADTVAFHERNRDD